MLSAALLKSTLVRGQSSTFFIEMARETGSWRWPAFAFTYMFGLAYGASFVTYRLATALL